VTRRAHPDEASRLPAGVRSDAQLVALARQGSDPAFEAIFERYRKPLERYCRGRLPEARVEDTVQQVFFGCWTALSRGQEPKHLRAWLYGAAHNAVVDALSQSGSDHQELGQTLPGGDDVEAELDRRTNVRETLASLARLPTRQREAMLGTALHGRSYEDVGRHLGVSHGAVAQLVHRARVTLRTGAAVLAPPSGAGMAAKAGAAASAAVVAVSTPFVIHGLQHDPGRHPAPRHLHAHHPSARSPAPTRVLVRRAPARPVARPAHRVVPVPVSRAPVARVRENIRQKASSQELASHRIDARKQTLDTRKDSLDRQKEGASDTRQHQLDLQKDMLDHQKDLLDHRKDAQGG
jgi:RNA polymerase sigma factor (sigma-70 family)